MHIAACRVIVLLFIATSLGCAGCNPSGNDGGGGLNNGGGGGDGDLFTAPDGAQCTEATPCGDCDQDCRPAGNPFAPVGQGDDTGFDGDRCTAHVDCKGFCGGSGVCEGFGTGGFVGDSCTTDNDCRGTCASGTCDGYGDSTGWDGDACSTDADCRGECGGNAVCTGSGTDPGDDGSGGSGGSGGDDDGGTGSGGGDGGTPDQTVCLDLETSLEHATPTVALLIDRSGSMEEPFGNGLNRLEAAYQALMDPTDGIVMQLQNSFRFGLSLFTSFSDEVTCPELSDVRPAIGNYEPIDRVFGMTFPAAGTPTGVAIEGTLRQFDVHPDQGRKILLLATDGEPNTCNDPYNDTGQPEAIAAVQQAYQLGIETIILSVGDNVGRAHLEDMANAGQGMQPGGAQQADYYEANNPAQLKTELQSIITSRSSCIFRVIGGVADPGLLAGSTVTLDGMALTYGDTNGWIYHQDRKTCEGAKQCIELRGTACETFQDGGSHTVEGDFLCTYYDPENPPAGDSGGDGENNNNGSGSGGDETGPCINANGSCEYDGDCCSGICGDGMCIVN